jgi:hypothetical protein
MLHHGIHFTTEEKSTENLNQGSQKAPVGHDSECRHDHLLTGSHNMFANTILPSDPSGNQNKHSVRVDICRAAELRDSSANFDLNLSVRALL